MYTDQAIVVPQVETVAIDNPFMSVVPYSGGGGGGGDVASSSLPEETWNKSSTNTQPGF